jgi:hypothetical protein
MKKKQDYFEKKELNKQKKLDAGVVSSLFPNVVSIAVLITYYKKLSNSVLMVRTVNFFPTSYAYFHMECIMKECVNGGFELTQAIKNLIKKHKISGKGKMVCNGKNDGLASGHTSIDYEISIKYKKGVK